MEKTILRVRIAGEPVLRKKAHIVKKITDEHRKLLSQMAQIMYSSSGIGLAAPQVGESLALIVVDIGDGLYKLINPCIVKKQGSQVIEEGCLSVPGISIKVKRAKKIHLKALDENGKPLNIKAEDLFACVIQHEIDHLNGKLIIDYASIIQKIKLKKKIAALEKKAMMI